MIELVSGRCELTYEGSFPSPHFALLDAPGRLCDLLLQSLHSFGCTPEDLAIEEGELAERGVACEIDRLNATVMVRGDRLELHCPDFALSMADELNRMLEGLWKALFPGVSAQRTSFLFEVDIEISGGAYQAVLDRLAPRPALYPLGTETAVVYYLPIELANGFGASSLVLNRSESVERGLQIGATLVYENGTQHPAVSFGRLQGLLRDLELDG